MSCACPGRLEMSRGSAEAKTRDIVVTLEFCGPSELMSEHLDHAQLSHVLSCRIALPSCGQMPFVLAQVVTSKVAS